MSCFLFVGVTMSVVKSYTSKDNVVICERQSKCEYKMDGVIWLNKEIHIATFIFNTHTKTSYINHFYPFDTSSNIHQIHPSRDQGGNNYDLLLWHQEHITLTHWLTENKHINFIFFRQKSRTLRRKCTEMCNCNSCKRPVNVGPGNGLVPFGNTQTIPPKLF